MKLSVYLFAFLFALFPVFTSCIFQNNIVKGNHQLVNNRIDIDNYEKVVFNVPGEVYYQQFSDSTPYLQIHTDENIFSILDVNVRNNQLIIDVKKGCNIRPSKLVIYTCSHNLNQVSLNGSGNFRLKGEVNSNDLTLGITGSGNLIADSLLCNNLSVNITGSGNTKLTGASNRSSFTIAGSGNIRAFDYLVQELTSQVSGSGNIEALVYDKLDAKIAGSGDIRYKGNPQSVNSSVTGSGKIKAVN